MEYWQAFLFFGFCFNLFFFVGVIPQGLWGMIVANRDFRKPFHTDETGFPADM